MLKLYKHQEKYAHGYKDKELVVWEGGTGKSLGASVWLKDNRDKDALIICPKRIIKKWEKELYRCGTKATVVSKEQFKKMEKKEWSAIVVDEADTFASPLFVKGRSQLSEKLYHQTMSYDKPILLLTATPIRSSPWNLHTLLWFLGKRINHKEWRDKFFTLTNMPYLPRPAWLPKKNWQKDIRTYLEANSDIVLLRDVVEDVPPISEEIIKVKCDKFENRKEWSPMASFIEEHKNEQKHKAEQIRKLPYRKIIVVAYYVEQVEELGKALTDRKVFVVHGGIKNQEDILKEASEYDECYLIVQASLGVGWDGDTFSCVVFASMSYRVTDFAQMKYRVRRLHNLHPVAYYYLIAGRCDKRIYETIQKGRDFTPSEWLAEVSK